MKIPLWSSLSTPNPENCRYVRMTLSPSFLFHFLLYVCKAINIVPFPMQKLPVISMFNGTFCEILSSAKPHSIRVIYSVLASSLHHFEITWCLFSTSVFYGLHFHSSLLPFPCVLLGSSLSVSLGPRTWKFFLKKKICTHFFQVVKVIDVIY